MNNKQHRTLSMIFENPVRSDIVWSDIERLVVGLGGEVKEREGSRVAFLLNERVAIFHRPHPEKVTNKLTVRDVRKFLVNAGVEVKEGQDEI
jgi:hypothetical protein